MSTAPSTDSAGNSSRSSSRAHSLSLRFKSRPSRPPTDPDHLSPTSATSAQSSSSMRRVASHEGTRRERSHSHSQSHSSTSSTPAVPPNDPLLRAARAKLSSQDQEAMRKLRSTMADMSDSGSSHGGASTSTSPQSPLFPVTPGISHAGPSSRLVRSRRSTLSRLVTADEGEPESEPTAGPSSPTKDSSAQFTIAIIGQPNSGRTTLINRAFKPYGVTKPIPLHLQSGANVWIYSSTMTSGTGSKMRSECQLVETDLDALYSTPDGLNPFSSEIPPVNGVLLCYDSNKQDTFLQLIPHIPHLAALQVPMVIFACHSDPDVERQVDPAYANSIGEPYNIGLIEVTDKTSDGRSKMRNGVRYLVSRLEQRLLRQRRKASQQTTPPTHKVLSPDSDASVMGDPVMWRSGLDMTGASTSAEGSKRGSMTPDRRSSSSSLHWIMQGPFADKRQSVDLRGLVDAESRSRSQSLSEQQPTSDLAPERPSGDGPMYIPLEDLLNQLFSKIVSTDDEPFVKSFFMTYRRFCAPRELMSQFLERYKEVESHAVAKDIKHWALQKLTGALIDWTTSNPGDLADGVTQDLFRQILHLLLKHMFMAHLTADLSVVEESFGDVVDIDASWALKPPGGAPTVASAGPSSVTPSSAQTELMIDGEILYDFESTLGTSDTGTPVTKEMTPSMRTVSTTSIAVDDSPFKSRSDPRLPTSSEDFRLSRGPPDDGSLKWMGAYHHVLSTEPKAFAMELTRVQWKLFAAIRPRDIFRHDFGKERDGPVGKAIDFFNHLSRWVSTIILTDPKPKHRARIYERFIMIAHQLRRLNNYDSLYALLSGMQETSVHRLAQTHALVQANAEMQKDFQSHTKLMDARGGYIHYRRALLSDISHGRSAIPLLTTLLGLINRLQTVRPEDIRPDGMVQWDKFARFGEILSIIPECQAKGAMVPGHPSPAFVKVLHDTPIIADEDGLFERSRMLEPAGGGGGGLGGAGHPSKVLKRFGKMAF